MRTRIKKTYITRDIHGWLLQSAIPADYRPKAGDTGIFEVLHIGKHKYVQGQLKRNITLIEGDHIMAAFGTRYATAQFEGYIPDNINQELHILGAGGTIGVLKSMHAKYEDIGPTSLRIVGLAVDCQNRIINTKEMMQKHMVKFNGNLTSASRIILSVGSSMDSGKTTTASYLIHGLKNAGLKVAFIKLTGTIYTKDADLAYDMGADVVTDFGDFGFPSTYMCEEQELLDLYENLVARVMPSLPDYIIIEIADGLYERETKMLLTNRKFTSTIDGVIFSAGDSLSAINGVKVLNSWGIHPLAIGGLLTASPLLIKEVKENTNIPVYTIRDLAFGNISSRLFSPVLRMAGNDL